MSGKEWGEEVLQGASPLRMGYLKVWVYTSCHSASWPQSSHLLASPQNRIPGSNSAALGGLTSPVPTSLFLQTPTLPSYSLRAFFLLPQTAWRRAL